MRRHGRTHDPQPYKAYFHSALRSRPVSEPVVIAPAVLADPGSKNIIREKMGDRHLLAIPQCFFYYCLNLSDSRL
jgi:hypothetical protein